MGTGAFAGSGAAVAGKRGAAGVAVSILSAVLGGAIGFGALAAAAEGVAGEAGFPTESLPD